MTGLDVIGFGALNVDKLYKVNLIAQPDEESFVLAYAQSCGGSAANTMVGLSRLGCKVGFIGKVGDDAEAKLQIDSFQSEGVNADGIIHSQGQSGSVMGFVDEDGERALYINSGVNDTITIEEVKSDYISGVKFVHLTSFVGEQSFITQKQLLLKLPKTVKVSFDPGALYARKGFAELEPIIQRAHIMMPNEHELEQITSKSDYRDGAAMLLDKGAKIVAVKLGRKGCYVTNGKECISIEGLKVKVVDTTGAGDAFCAGFLYGLLKKKNLTDCGKIGNIVASRKVQKMGAREGLPTADELKLLI